MANISYQVRPLLHAINCFRFDEVIRLLFSDDFDNVTQLMIWCEMVLNFVNLQDLAYDRNILKLYCTTYGLIIWCEMVLICFNLQDLAYNRKMFALRM